MALSSLARCVTGMGRCTARAERGSNWHCSLCPQGSPALLSWVICQLGPSSPSCLSPLSILLPHPPFPRLSCAVPKIHTQTWAVTPGGTFEGRPRGCYGQTLPPSCANPAVPMPGPCLCLLPLSLRSLHPSPCSFSYFLLTTRSFNSDFPQWLQAHLIPMLQPATVLSFSPYYIHCPNFVFLSLPHHPPVPPPSALCSFSPLHCRQIWKQKK